jgi:hypothetical protein
MISTRHLLDYASGPREAAALRQEYGATLHDLITVILADWLEQHGEDEHSEADSRRAGTARL